jgi:hypothetical protein
MNGKVRLLACLLVAVLPVFAKQPMPGKMHTQVLETGRTLEWLLLRNRDMAWQLTVSEQSRILVNAILGECRFCDGDEDGCRMTGVFIRSLKESGDPVILVVCHTASHTTLLQLFDPAVSSASPAMRIRGSYYLEWSGTKEGLMIEWDGPDHAVPGCEVESLDFPDTAPAQNRLMLDSPCYRQGHTTE